MSETQDCGLLSHTSVYPNFPMLALLHHICQFFNSANYNQHLCSCHRANSVIQFVLNKTRDIGNILKSEKTLILFDKNLLLFCNSFCFHIFHLHVFLELCIHVCESVCVCAVDVCKCGICLFLFLWHIIRSLLFISLFSVIVSLVFEAWHCKD